MCRFTFMNHIQSAIVLVDETFDFQWGYASTTQTCVCYFPPHGILGWIVIHYSPIQYVKVSILYVVCFIVLLPIGSLSDPCWTTIASLACLLVGADPHANDRAYNEGAMANGNASNRQARQEHEEADQVEKKKLQKVRRLRVVRSLTVGDRMLQLSPARWGSDVRAYTPPRFMEVPLRDVRGWP